MMDPAPIPCTSHRQDESGPTPLPVYHGTDARVRAKLKSPRPHTYGTHNKQLSTNSLLHRARSSVTPCNLVLQIMYPYEYSSEPSYSSNLQVGSMNEPRPACQTKRSPPVESCHAWAGLISKDAPTYMQKAGLLNLVY